MAGVWHCKMWMSMMAPDEVDMAHKVVKYGMCIVKEMNVVKRENDLLRKEVGELRLQSINKDKEVTEVKRIMQLLVLHGFADGFVVWLILGDMKLHASVEAFIH